MNTWTHVYCYTGTIQLQKLWSLALLLNCPQHSALCTPLKMKCYFPTALTDGSVWHVVYFYKDQTELLIFTEFQAFKGWNNGITSTLKTEAVRGTRLLRQYARKPKLDNPPPKKKYRWFQSERNQLLIRQQCVTVCKQWLADSLCWYVVQPSTAHLIGQPDLSQKYQALTLWLTTAETRKQWRILPGMHTTFTLSTQRAGPYHYACIP
jgi:hypothetical protein